MTLKKIILRAISIVLLTFVSFIVLTIGYCNLKNTTYKFGIIAENYKDILGERPNYFAYNENTNKMSWFSPIKLPNSDIVIKVEHLQPVVEFDTRLIPELDSTRFFATLIEYDSKEIVSVHISNEVNGSVLERVCTYLYYNPPENEPELYPLGWKVVPVTPDRVLTTVETPRAFGQFFRFPERVGPSFLWFQGAKFKDARQTITITYYDRSGNLTEHTFQFDLFWYLFMTGFDKFITIT